MDHIDSSRSVEYQAIGRNIYSSRRGATVVKFSLSDDRASLDPQSLRVQYKITNIALVVAGKVENLYFIKSHTFFSRMRLMTMNATIEDIGEYATAHEMFTHLKPDNETKGDLMEWF